MFNADVASSMQWNFKPQQKEITVVPGETALAFYTATNPTDNQIVGISTYNVLPFDVGQYFNKIQCFCFEEQMLNPHEQVSSLASNKIIYSPVFSVFNNGYIFYFLNISCYSLTEIMNIYIIYMIKLGSE